MSDDPSTPAADLPSFLKKHVRPYDPVTDEYERPPFAEDIKEGKNDPIYSAHSYHTKVPPRSIVPYILHYTRPGDLVLDPFCGSGMTGVAAQLCAQPPADLLDQFPELKERVGPRACLLNDLSPAACHIAYNYNTPVGVATLRSEFARIRAAVAEEFAWLYGTEHYEPAVGVYEPVQPEVAGRLKNPPIGIHPSKLLDETERTWELATREQIEERLGYPVAELPRSDAWGDLDPSNVEQWVCIPATIQYTIWSDVYKCEGFVTIDEPTGKISTRGKNTGKPITRKSRVHRGCGQELVLWDLATDRDTGDVTESFVCPSCKQEWQKKQLTLLSITPVVTDYEYIGLRFKRSVSTPVRFRTARKTAASEKDFLHRLSGTPIPYWHPADPVDCGREMLRHGLLKRGIQTIEDFYTRRNLWALSRLWTEINAIGETRIREFFRFAFTSIIPYVCLKQSYGGGGGGLSSTLYIASFISEKHVGEVFERKEKSLFKSLPKFNALAERIDARAIRGSADSLPIPDESVDYVFSDPPFGSNIYYADCSLLWETWLGQITNEAQEMVVSDRRVNGPFKTLEDYSRMMSAAFGEMFRVLKPGRWATIEFNNSDGRVFAAIKKAVTDAGFEIANMLLLDKKQKSFKQVKGAKGEEDVVDKDVLFNLHKPSTVRPKAHGEERDLEQQVAEAVRQHLTTLPDRITAEPSKYSDDHRTTATINSMLMNALIPRGVSVERLNLPFIERVCGRFFRKIGQRWYLRGEAVGGNGGDLVAQEMTISDELTAIAWLRQKLHGSPKIIGELKPLWMKATVLLPAALSQSLVLETLLRENFWRDAASNRWREPTPEEREKINDDRALRVLHDADRLAAGTLGRTPTSRELCEWIAVLFDTSKELAEGEATAETHPGFDVTEAYRLIVKLSHRLTPDGVEPSTLSAAQKQVRVAGQRLAAAAEDAEAAAPKRTRRVEDDKQTVFDL